MPVTVIRLPFPELICAIEASGLLQANCVAYGSFTAAVISVLSPAAMVISEGIVSL